MRPGLGVVPELGVVDRDLPQEPAARKFVERVVDRAERRRELDRPRLVIDHFGGEVPVSRAEDRAGEIEPLAGRTHPRGGELAHEHAVADIGMRSALRFHGHHMSLADGRNHPRPRIPELD